MSLSGYSSRLPADVLLNTGVLFVGNSPLSASRGGLSFDPGTTFRQVPYDGQTADVVGLDRKVYIKPTIKGKFLQYTHHELAKFEPGANVHLQTTPLGAGIMLVVGQYVNNLRLIFERASGGYVEVVFPKALCEKYTVAGQDKSEPEVDAEFTAKRDTTVQTTEGLAPYYIKEIASIS
jgi:hypothetical protein